MEYIFEIFIFLLSLVSLYYCFHERSGIPTNWPIVGMLPAVIKNIPRMNDYFAEIVEKTKLTFLFKGPWFTNMYILATVDPANVHHVMSKNFGNYPKGKKFKEIFDVLGDGIFNADSNIWQYHRMMAQSFLGHPMFHQFLAIKIEQKLEHGLVPMLDYVSKQGIEIDLQDLFARFTFDNICAIVMDYDPLSLSIDLPSVPPSNALDDIEEVLFYRHAVPPCVWKLIRWLDVAQEKKYREAWQILDTFIYNCIAIKKERMSNESSPSTREKTHTKFGSDLLTSYMEENEKHATLNNTSDKFLRDTILNFFIAGRDTTSTALSWFFYLVSTNPNVLSKIRGELKELTNQNDQDFAKSSREFYGKLVYLHAAFCEALRLYPPVVFEVKHPLETDVLPSGHKMEPPMQIMFNMYAMARMKSIWGEDCCEFKPERWISENGKIKHEPSYKFFAFNAGPRTCVGKEMAFTQMKAIASAVISNYDIKPVEGCIITPDISIILRMKHGFRVKVVRLK